ncbi:MAG: S9 family peptidase [Vicinamibacteria bacterium]|nr:S9 family peptidase [Vicinamibacteria bacterium]
MSVRAGLLVSLVGATVAGCSSPREAPTPPPRTIAHYSVADFYKNAESFGASFSADGTKILVSSNRSGIWNAYAIPTAGGEAEPLTSSTTNAIFAASYFPKDGRLLYSSDEGGNELSHLFVRNPDGTTKDLTPGKKLSARFAGWAQDDTSFFVASNERDQRYFDLYEHAADGYARTLLYRNTKGLELGPLSRDKRYLALVKPRTTNDSDIWLVDRKTGTTRNITAHTGDVSNSPAAFSPDGTTLLFVSDAGREFKSLRSHDLATGTQKAVLEPNWDVWGADYSKSGKYLTVWINEDAAYTSRLYDAATLKEIQIPGMPTGLVRGLQLSRDDAKVAFYASDGSVPDDLFAGSVAERPARLTNTLNPAITREDLVVPTRVRFTSYDGTEIPGLLYTPHQATSAAKAPAVVMVHGGPGGQAQFGYFALTQALVNHGYVVFDINNRGSTGYGKTFYAMDDRRHGEADLGDVVASKQMLVATGYVDPARIGIMGGSYGGYMTLAALTLQPDAFKVGVDLFGISNWVRTLENMPPWWASFKEALYAEMGDPKTDAERLRRISPLFNASKIKAPLMVLQGANDPRVLQVESDEIVAAAKSNGVPTEYIVFPDEGHGFVKKENEIRGYTAILAFLDKHLKGTTAAATR